MRSNLLFGVHRMFAHAILADPEPDSIPLRTEASNPEPRDRSSELEKADRFPSDPPITRGTWLVRVPAPVQLMGKGFPREVDPGFEVLPHDLGRVPVQLNQAGF